jgi:hypothetical protein
MRYLCCCLMLILSAPLLAQQDQRVSIEPTTTVLPEEIRIQAAASIGSNTLVVWGGNRAHGRDTAISNLQAQLLRDTVVQGSPRQIHSDEARPFGYVSVVPFDDRYLVLWNDRRPEQSGVYMRWVDSDGSTMGSEEIFSGALATATSIRVFRTSSHTLIFHTVPSGSQTAGLYLRRYLHDGSAAGAEELIAQGTGIGVERLAGFEDLFVVRSGSSIRVFSDIGGFESRTVPAGRFDRPWYLGTDSLFVTLVDTTLHYYTSLFAPTPFRSVTIPALRDIDSHTAVLTRDGNRIQITYPGLEARWELIMTVIRIVIDANGDISPPDTLHRYVYWPASTSYVERVGIGPTVVTRYCGNIYDVRLNFWSRNYDSRNRLTSEGAWDWGFTVGEHGDYQVEENREVKRKPPVVPCFDASLALMQHAVTRRSAINTSTVSISTRTLPQVGSRINGFAVHVEQGIPNIFRRDGRLMTTWRQGGEYPPNILAEWKPREEITSLISSSPSLANPLKGLTTTLLPLIENWTDHSYEPAVNISRSTLYMVDSQWSYRYGYNSDRATLRVWTTPDQNRNESVVVAYLPSLLGFAALWIDSSGVTARSTNLYMSVNQYPRLELLSVPVDSLSLLVYRENSRQFFEIRNGIVRDSFAIDLVENYGIQVRRLYGSHFLCFNPAFNANDPVATIYSLKGTKEYARRLPVDRSYTHPFIVESPVDSTIHILWESNKGVRLTRLDKYLRVLVRDSLISQTQDTVRSPAGVFRNDTLFVVWQDFRNRTTDIYGTAFVAHRVVAVPPDTTTAREGTTSYGTILPIAAWPPPERPIRLKPVTIAAVTPNPADNVATFFVELAEPGDAIAEIRDMTGQVLIRREKSFDMDSGRWDIDIDDLTSGMYILSVRSGGGIDTRKLVVVKR